MSTQETGSTGGLAGLKAAMAAHAAGGQQETRTEAPRSDDDRPRYKPGTPWEQCGDWDCFSDEPPPGGIHVSMFSFADRDEQMAYYKRMGWTRERSKPNQTVHTAHEGDEATG